jgi:Na+/H+-dicarboxylate symporter/ABC-type amino acid transport substrate-binding protein
VLLGLVAGIGAGLFFGDTLAFLQAVGQAFIELLQMTVLPYVVLSLVSGIGRLTYQEISTLALRVGAVLLGSWALAMLAILVMPLAFPAVQSASFFSTSLIAAPASFDFLHLFIPANPFHALANNLVPAVVLFSIAVGLALISFDNKQSLLEPLTLLNRAMTRITQFVSTLTPFGVFAVTASAAGTMSVEEFERLQVYLVLYVAMAVLLTLWVLPGVITSLTPLTYTQVLGHTKDILITTFATNSALVVLPLVVERSKELLRQGKLNTPETESTVEVIVPAFTSFPKIGTLLPMSFVLFAGWFTGAPVSVTQYPTFILAGLASFFGHANVAIPLLLDLFRIPADTFQLYLALNIIVGRLASLLTVMNNLVLTVVGACALGGLLTVRRWHLLRHAGLTVVLAAGLLGGARLFFSYSLSNAYDKDKVIARMQLLRYPGPATVYTSPPPPPPEAPPQSRLERIRARQLLRVGYVAPNLPFAYFNGAGDLVGLDIEMAHALARELGVALAFVPVTRAGMAEQLHRGTCDLVMSGIPVTTDGAAAMAFSTPYLEQTMAFIVKDHRRAAFSSREAVKRLKAPRIGVLNIPYYIDAVHHYLPHATLVVLNTVPEFFTQRGEELDAFVYAAEAGSAWTLLYPAYTVAIPQPDVLAIPLAYPMARGDPELVNFINTWIELKKRDRTIATLYEYWMLGKNAVPQPPRWSVIRNVLHWVD